MFDAQLLRADAEGSTAVYSPWFARGGDNARCTVEVVALGSNSRLTVDLFHKNREDTGDGSVVTGGSIASTATGRSDDEWEGLKELVRYKFTVDNDAVPATEDPWVLFRMLSIVWFDAVEA